MVHTFRRDDYFRTADDPPGSELVCQRRGRFDSLRLRLRGLAECSYLCFNGQVDTMWVNSFYSSTTGPCGISIFSRHLRGALMPLGVKLLETNFRTSMSVVRTLASLVHYVPSSFASSQASEALTQFLLSANDDEKILIILHGLHSYGENRFQSDTICPDQGRHIRLMLYTADSIIALSDAAAKACRTWQARFGGKARLIRLDHPGLYAPMRSAGTGGSYALLGGISRSKKDHTTGRMGELIDLCQNRGIKVWQHWTSVERPQSLRRSWRQTSGLLTDTEWSSLVSHAQVVLCPYQTRIQSVSGLISEALSADCFVLATSFELALEMQRRVPARICIEDNLDCWPNLILQLPSSGSCASAGVPTWDSFARHIAVELLTAVRSYKHGGIPQCLARVPVSVDWSNLDAAPTTHIGIM